MLEGSGLLSRNQQTVCLHPTRGTTRPTRLRIGHPRAIQACIPFPKNHMNTPQPNARRRSAAGFPPLLHVLRDPNLYPLFRAPIAGEISKLMVPASFFTFELEADEVLADDENLKTVRGSIGVAVGNRRVRATPKKLRGVEGQLTLILSAPVKQKLMIELAALLANLSGADLETACAVPATHPADQRRGPHH